MGAGSGSPKSVIHNSMSLVVQYKQWFIQRILLLEILLFLSNYMFQVITVVTILDITDFVPKY